MNNSPIKQGRCMPTAEALHNASQLSKQIIQSVHEGVIVYDRDLRYQLWNPFMERITGIFAQDILGRHPSEVFPFLMEVGMMARLERALAGEHPGTIDFFYSVPKTGRAGWAADTSSPLLNADGEIIGVIATVSDITERKEAEELLRKSEEKYRLLFESAGDAIFIHDEEGRILEVNPQAVAHLGYPHEELLSLTLSQVDSPEESQHIPERMAMLMGHGNHRFETVHRRKDGSLIPTGVNLRRIVWDGEPAIMSICRDITKRKQAEEALQESERRLNNLIDFLPDATLAIDSEKKVIVWNKAIEKMTGIKAAEMIGKGNYEYTIPFYGERRPQLMDLVWDHDRTVMEKYSSVKREAESLNAETFCGALYDGRGAHVFAKVSPLHDENGNIVGAIESIRDISELKRAEEMLARANAGLEVRVAERTAELSAANATLTAEIAGRKQFEKKLLIAKKAAEVANLAKSQFLANMSHELRTPMTGILGMLELALEEELSPVPRGYLETTLSSARSLLRILNDILDMAKFEAGKLTIVEKPFSLKLLINEAVDIIIPEVHRKGLDFALSVAEKVPDRVAGDQVRLRQVLNNLIGNAVKFTEGGKVELRVTAGGATSDGKREFTFAVTDTGIGIPDDKKELLFRAFSQVDASHSRSFGGTGLGLAISREIVGLMGGTINFESAQGVGSTFSFTIPLAEAGLESHALSTAEPLSPEATTPAPEGERIPHLLLAEDDPTIRAFFGQMLIRSNYKLDFAEDGLEAVEMWEKGGYDLVLMDIQMPRLDGLEATRAIREKERERGGHVPIVAVTAYALKEDEERCLAAGMDAYISKPINFKKSLQVIGEIIKQKSGGGH